jgi:hypothetical protein
MSHGPISEGAVPPVGTAARVAEIQDPGTHCAVPVPVLFSDIADQCTYSVLG